MKRIVALFLCLIVSLPAGLTAQDGQNEQIGQGGPVVVELFTSQGCAACPPADKLLHYLAQKPGVLPLALHVDYWDYIGWPDTFARAEHTLRQKIYAARAERRAIYTPQMIVGGEEAVMGAHAMELADRIAAHKARPAAVTLRARRQGDELQLSAAMAPGAAARPMEVQLVRYAPMRKAEITRGENAGHSFTYANVVEDWTVLGEWDGESPLKLEVEIEGDLPAAVIVQESGQGPIRAAARVD